MLYMVLEDGETFSSLHGCKVVDIDESVDGDDVDVAIKDVFGGETDDGRIVAKFTDPPENDVAGVTLFHPPALAVEQRIL